MPLTKSFKRDGQGQDSAKRGISPGSAEGSCWLHDLGRSGDGKSILRKYINGTVGFVQLGAGPWTLAQSADAHAGSERNPQARSLFGIVAHLQKVEVRSLKSSTVLPHRRPASRLHLKENSVPALLVVGIVVEPAAVAVKAHGAALGFHVVLKLARGAAALQR